MATPTPAQLATLKSAMLENFDQYRISLDEAMDEVESSLKRNEYALACRQLSAISQQHARTSVAFRNALIKQGFLARETEDD